MTASVTEGDEEGGRERGGARASGRGSGEGEGEGEQEGGGVVRCHEATSFVADDASGMERCVKRAV